MQAMPERWTPETYNDFLAELKQEADEAYRLFNEKLLASELPTLGLRLPFLRKTAKTIAKGDPRGFLAVCGKTYHEERLLYGLVAAELPYADFLPHSDKMAKFLVENWAICDTFCSSLKKVLSHKADKAHYFRYISVYLSSLNPWTVRVWLIVMLHHYLTPTTINTVLTRTLAVDSDFYYVRMAQAWLLAEAWVKFPEETKKAVLAADLDPWVFRKFVQKARESRRVSDEDKEYLKSLIS